ncbi:MAG: DotH/IcmK family type IV secretion protein [Pseudomonadota bacterium]
MSLVAIGAHAQMPLPSGSPALPPGLGAPQAQPQAPPQLPNQVAPQQLPATAPTPVPQPSVPSNVGQPGNATSGLPSLTTNPALNQGQAVGLAPGQPGLGAATAPVQFGAPPQLPPGVPSFVATPGTPQPQGQPGGRVSPQGGGLPVPLNQAATTTGFGAGVQPQAEIDFSQLAVLPTGQIVPIDQIPSAEELAFQQVLDGLLPLNPDQIRELRRQIDITDRAAADPVRPEQPSVSSLDVSLAPGRAPPEIRTAAGRVTALSFYDVTGAPYPVSAVVIGNPNLFQVEAPIPEGNLVTITPLAPYAEGNMVITLLDQSVPILVKLLAGTEVVDYRLDMRVGARGPLAAAPVQFVDSSPQVGGPLISSFLDGLPPDTAEPVALDQPGLSAWRLNNALYLRTRMTLLSPAWSNSAAGAGGLKVYVVPDVPVLLASDNGRLVSVRVVDQES